MIPALNMSASKPMWGKIDAAHIFCEPKYATSPYFAEFYNAISSFVYVIAGGVGLALSCRYASDPEARSGLPSPLTACEIEPDFKEDPQTKAVDEYFIDKQRDVKH